MREWKTKQTLHEGTLYYDVASTARFLRTTAAKVHRLMSQGELQRTQIKVGGKLLVRATSIVAYKDRRLQGK
jgi:Helix-turn-helix domain